VAVPKPTLAFFDAAAHCRDCHAGWNCVNTSVAGTLTTRKGFETMVDHSALGVLVLFLLTGVSLLVLGWEPKIFRPFLSLYPLTHTLLCALGYLLYSSLAYTSFGAILSVAMVVAVYRCYGIAVGNLE